jgi:hypothetical protein
MSDKLPFVDTMTSAVELGSSYAVIRERSVVMKYEPVAAVIVGPGTSAVIPGGAIGASLPEGAVLVSNGQPSGFAGSWS